MAVLPNSHEPRRVIDAAPPSSKQSATTRGRRFPVLVMFEVVETHCLSHVPE